MPETVLITGATGVVGQALLDRLDVPHVIGMVHRSALPQEDVEVIRGDVCRPDLGLGAAAYRELAKRVDAIIHSAAVVDFTKDEDVILTANVTGTEHALALAAAADAPIYHVGTALVKPGARAEADWSGASALAKGTDAYRRSKVAAEGIVGKSGLPHTIYRPSLMQGDSRTGAIAKFQGIHYLIGYAFDGYMPFLPLRPDSGIDIIPQDVVADAIACMVEQDEVGGTWWLTLGDTAPTIGQLIELGAEFGERIGRPWKPPRYTDPDIVERLIRPVFMDEFPPKIRKRLERMLEFNAYMNPGETLPTDIPEMQERFGVAPMPELRSAFLRGLEFWAEAKGLTRRVDA